MKKIFSNCLVAAFMLVAAVSCDRKTSDLVPDPSQVNVTSGEDFLHFRTESEYDSALVNPKLSLKAPAGFASLSSVRSQAPTAKTNANDKEREAPEQLTRLLNKDGVMQVGNWVIKLNFEDKLVRVIANDQKNKLYTKLLKEQKDQDIYVFSFEDEVFALLDEGITESPTLVKATNGRINFLCFGGISGGRIFRQWNSQCTQVQYPSPNSAGYEVGTDFDKFGVYYRLYAEIRVYLNPLYSNGINVSSNCLYNGTFEADIYWRSNCNNYNEGTWPGSGTHNYSVQFNSDLSPPGITCLTQYWDLYSSSRGLKCVKIYDFRLLNQNMSWNYLDKCNI